MVLYLLPAQKGDIPPDTSRKVMAPMLHMSEKSPVLDTSDKLKRYQPEAKEANWQFMTSGLMYSRVPHMFILTEDSPGCNRHRILVRQESHFA